VFEKANESKENAFVNVEMSKRGTSAVNTRDAESEADPDGTLDRAEVVDLHAVVSEAVSPMRIPPLVEEVEDANTTTTETVTAPVTGTFVKPTLEIPE